MIDGPADLTRVQALDFAIRFAETCGENNMNTVVSLADTFHDFLTGNNK